MVYEALVLDLLTTRGAFRGYGRPGGIMDIHAGAVIWPVVARGRRSVRYLGRVGACARARHAAFRELRGWQR